MAFTFTPPTGLNDTSAFPAKDTGFRARLQTLLQQIPTYVDAQKASKTYENPIAPTLINSWVNQGSFYCPIEYWKDDLEIVHIRGNIKSGTIGTIFTLPVGYRPTYVQDFPVLNQGDLLKSIEILTDGSIKIYTAVTGMVSIEISFRVGV